jgi:hypothetical protein
MGILKRSWWLPLVVMLGGADEGCEPCGDEVYIAFGTLPPGMTFTALTYCTTACHSNVVVEWTQEVPTVYPAAVAVYWECGTAAGLIESTSYARSPTRIEDFNVKNVCGEDSSITYTTEVTNTTGLPMDEVTVYVECPDAHIFPGRQHERGSAASSSEWSSSPTRR